MRVSYKCSRNRKRGCWLEKRKTGNGKRESGERGARTVRKVSTLCYLFEQLPSACCCAKCGLSTAVCCFCYFKHFVAVPQATIYNNNNMKEQQNNKNRPHFVGICKVIPFFFLPCCWFYSQTNRHRKDQRTFLPFVFSACLNRCGCTAKNSSP